MTETQLRPFTVCAAFYDCDSRATLTVQATDFADACNRAARMVDDGEATTATASYDPGRTFIYGVVDGADGCPWNGTENVPESWQCPEYRTAAERAAPAMLAALRRVASCPPAAAWLENAGGIYSEVTAAIRAAEGDAPAPIAAPPVPVETTAAPDVVGALRALMDWAREHTSPLDANSPHELLIEAHRAIAAVDSGAVRVRPVSAAARRFLAARAGK